jgi:hypothetical protein
MDKPAFIPTYTINVGLYIYVKIKFLFLLVAHTITSECLGPQELFVYQTQNGPFLGNWAEYQNKVPLTSTGACVYLSLHRAWMSCVQFNLC